MKISCRRNLTLGLVGVLILGLSAGGCGQSLSLKAPTTASQNDGKTQTVSVSQPLNEVLKPTNKTADKATTQGSLAYNEAANSTESASSQSDSGQGQETGKSKSGTTAAKAKQYPTQTSGKATLLTKSKFNQLVYGSSFKQVVASIGSPALIVEEEGDKNGTNYTVTYQYKGNGGTGSQAIVEFQGDKLVHKVAFGLK